MSGYFDELGAQLVAAAQRRSPAGDPATSEPARRPKWRSKRVMGLAAAIVVTAGVPAAAVTGVFKPYREVDGLVRLSPQRVVADGTTTDGRYWELTTSRSDVGFCLGLRLPPPSATESRILSEGCGGKSPEALSVATISGGSRSGNDALVFGTAPEQATQVRVEGRRVPAVEVKALEGAGGERGRFYLVELPTRKAPHPVTVTALDANGRAIAEQHIG